jgi:hypothetical protein
MAKGKGRKGTRKAADVKIEDTVEKNFGPEESRNAVRRTVARGLGSYMEDDFVMVLPPKFTRFCYPSTRRCQLPHHKPLGIAQFQQISPRAGIWFGTQIASKVA